MASYYSSSTPLQRPPNNDGYTETSSFYGVHIPSNIKRRKRSPHQNHWAKYATKCVVASPLIVLVLWSVAVMAHSSSSSPQQTIASSSTARTSTNAVVVEPSHQGGNNQSATSSSSLPVYVPLGQQQSSSSSSTIVVRPRPHPRGQVGENTQGGNAMTIAASQNAMTTTKESDGNAMQNDVGRMNTQNEMAVMANGYAQSGVPNGVILMNTQGGNAMTTTTSTTQYDNAMLQQQGVMTMGDNVIAAAEIAENVLGNTLDNNAAMSNLQKSSQVNNVYPAVRKTTKILYYDPAVGTETVYDADGTPILLSSLQTDTTEIYLEKPPPALEETTPVGTLEYEWGESQAQDQMIIISTVATMALLVGALSARRMRSRQFLSSCIENESLADEVAYDTAYTTNGYDTFGVGGGPWKGDLEKFDV